MQPSILASQDNDDELDDGMSSSDSLFMSVNSIDLEAAAMGGQVNVLGGMWSLLNTEQASLI
jgi:hypothetical protein